jgi:ribosomal protein S20
MQKIILVTLLMLATMLTKLTAQEVEYPLDWSYRQDATESYEIGPDKTPEFSNQNILTIKSVKSKINGFGNIMKTIKPGLYLGKTVKMTAYVKSKNVKSWAGLWMRVDYYTVDVLSFDNMRRRAIKGTTDWTKHEVILFVPADATAISYGVLLNGTGQIWFKDVKLEVVDDTVPETGMNKGREHKVVSFEKRAKAIAEQIKTINDSQKNALKAEIEALDKEVAKGIISKEKAEELKLKKARECAANIDAKVAIEEGKLSQLIQDKVDGKFEEENTDKKRGTSIVVGGSNDSIGMNQTEINITSLKVYQGQKDKEDRKSKRTTSQIVFAAGLNNLMTDGKIQDSDYRFLGSHFYEWGATYNTRIAKNNNLLHAKYGLSVMYNNIRPTDNRSFVVNGDQTNLEINAIDLKDSRFRNVYLVAPVHLEFDFSGKKIKEDKTFFKTHQSFRFGIGGYAGINLKSKQILKYEEGDHKTTERVRGDFNTSNFIYGLSTYIGYKETSLYLKYDLNPLFKDNAVKQNNVSLGLRFDFN